MRYLGIDFGEKNIGLALSDPENKMAFPLSVLSNSEKIIEEISNICRDKKIETIIIGESKNYSGEENEIMKQIHLLAKKMEEEIKIPVRLHPEFLTSVQAEKLQGQNDMNDASAAAIMLTSYLDSQNNA